VNNNKVVNNIKILKVKKRRNVKLNDPKKESVIKELCSIIEGYGYNVRREQLKQGIGWKVMSGTCRKEADRILFLDRKLPQGEQVTFLLSQLVKFSQKSVGDKRPSEDQIKEISEETRQLLDQAFQSISTPNLIST
jgi:hypothetical protein